jgi:hypothetical protein
MLGLRPEINVRHPNTIKLKNHCDSWAQRATLMVAMWILHLPAIPIKPKSA